MTEQQIQHKILKALKKRKCYAVKIIAANRAGAHDILCCLWPSGKFVSIEVKRPGEEPTVLQMQHGKEILAAGGWWFCVHSLEEMPWHILR